MVFSANQNGSTPITAVISTRNRPEDVVKAVGSILACDYPNFELRVVDQSDDDLTERALELFLHDPRFCYIKTSTRGVSRGRNLAISGARSELVAITDDDCEVPTNWLSEMVKAFNRSSRTGVVFGRVLEGDHDEQAGYIPTYKISEPFTLSRIDPRHPTRGVGIGACMGLRRSAWVKVGGMDEMMGPGAPLRAFEDADFAIRALLAGFEICNDPAVTVVHNGFRSWKQGRAHSSVNWYGIGAGCVKHLKCGRWISLALMDGWLRGMAWRDIKRHLIEKHRISGLTPLLAFGQGFLAGCFMAVDSTTGKYVQRKGSLLPLHESADLPVKEAVTIRF